VYVVGLRFNHQDDLQGSKTNFYAMDEYAWRIGIVEGESDKILVAGWELSHKSSIDDLLQALKADGVTYQVLDEQACKQRKVQTCLSFQDPAGNTLEVFSQMDLDYLPLNSKVNVKKFETGFHGSMGLGHYVIPTNNFKPTYAFYTDVLGFGQTDFMQFEFVPEHSQDLHFLHVDNPRHHSLAIFEDPNPPEHGCVHLMFEVLTVDEVGSFIDRVNEAGIKIQSSLGKHTNDEMVSVYVETPSGFALEFGTGGVQHDWQDYKPTVSSRPSLWGHKWNH